MGQTYCYDCEIGTMGRALCSTCADHRARCPLPIQYEASNIDPNTGRVLVDRWYCHGAGPSGTALKRIEEEPYTLTGEECTTGTHELEMVSA